MGPGSARSRSMVRETFLPNATVSSVGKQFAAIRRPCTVECMKPLTMFSVLLIVIFLASVSLFLAEHSSSSNPGLQVGLGIIVGFTLLCMTAVQLHEDKQS